MRNRCLNPANRKFPLYGARGITICDRWDDYVLFLADMGERPAGCSIERVNNDGNYEPGNCVWAKPTQQARNRRCVKLSLEKAEEIRLRAAAGERGSALAVEYGVTHTQIIHVVAGRQWKQA